MDRCLSPFERFVWAVDTIRTINMALAARVSGPVTPQLLREAIAAVRLRHPLLGVRLVERGPWRTRFVTEGVPDPELRVASTPTHPSDRDHALEAALQTELRRCFDPRTGPLARFLMLDAGDGSFDLVFTAHHLVTDGRSGVQVLDDLLLHLADPVTGLPPVPAWPADDLLPDRRARFSDLLTFTRMYGGTGRPPPPDWAGPATVTAWSLDRTETAALLDRCHAERCSPKAALCAAFTRANPSPVHIAIPADLRALLIPTPRNAFGLYSTTFLTTLSSTAATPFWDLARSVEAALRHHELPARLVPLTRVFRLMRLLPRRPLGYVLARSEARSAHFDLCVDVEDVPEFLSHGAYQVTDLYPAVHPSLSGAPLIAVGCLDGRLFLTVTCAHGPTATTLRDRAMTHLRGASLPPPSPHPAAR
jgi:hypothetical protein